MHHALITRDVEVIAASGARFPFLKEVTQLGGGSNTLLAVRHIRERCPEALLLLALLQPFYTEGGLLACRTRPS